MPDTMIALIRRTVPRAWNFGIAPRLGVGNSEGDHEMLPTILIVLLVLLLVGEESARRPAAERSAVANKAAATRERASL
jgi:hypothetical protein